MKVNRRIENIHFSGKHTNYQSWKSSKAWLMTSGILTIVVGATTFGSINIKADTMLLTATTLAQQEAVSPVITQVSSTVSLTPIKAATEISTTLSTTNTAEITSSSSAAGIPTLSSSSVSVSNNSLATSFNNAVALSNISLIGVNPNSPESLDSNSMNTVDGYLSYTGWFRPSQIHVGGKTWQATSSSDWRPYLMYVWPDQATEKAYLSYFLTNGYSNSANGLTLTAVGALSSQNADVQATALTNYAAIMRDNIEAKIVSDGSAGVGNLANTMSAFIATQPAFTLASELPVESSIGSYYTPDNAGTSNLDQVIFVNNTATDVIPGNTSEANSPFRLMNRTTNNQKGTTIASDLLNIGPELLVGNDMDNSNPVVQAENLNWEYFLQNFGSITANNPQANFDGFRVDAADNIDADVLSQLSQLFGDMYGKSELALNNHLIYNEGYVTQSALDMQNASGNQQIMMDAWYYYTLQNTLATAPTGKTLRDSLAHLATNSLVNRVADSTQNTATPNWSFVNNHDQQKNRINQIMIDTHPNDPNILGTGYTKVSEQAAIKTFIQDENSTNKKYAEYNIPAQYALLLTNKDTIPSVYYGDLYNEFAPYMSQQTIYYNAISSLMMNRSKYVAGGQIMTNYGNNLSASVRLGLGNNSLTDMSNQGRTSGIAVIVGNDPAMTSTQIKVAMGADHANQKFMSLLVSTATGISETPQYLTTDSRGNLTITAQGYSNPQVSGYLSVWVPVGAAATQNVYTAPINFSTTNGKTYESNAALDSHVIYEDFSLYEPEADSISNNQYTILAANAQNLAKLGITDVWMAPAYKSFAMSRYNEGYAIADRYDLGASSPTKYGTAAQLATAIEFLHTAGLKVQADLVLNQMFGLDQQEAVTATRTDNYGQANVPTVMAYTGGQTFNNQVYFAYTKGGGAYQQQYGGAYLSLLQQKYPNLFSTPAVSTGKVPDPRVQIKQWSAKYENGTSLQGIGLDLPMCDSKGNYYYLRSDNNSLLTTYLPNALSATTKPQFTTGTVMIDGKSYSFNPQGILVSSNLQAVNYSALIYQDNKVTPDLLYSGSPNSTNTVSAALYNGQKVTVQQLMTIGVNEYAQIQLANGQKYWIDNSGITTALTNYTSVNKLEAVVKQIGRSDGLYLGGPYGSSLTKSPLNSNASEINGSTVTILAKTNINGQIWDEVQTNTGLRYWLVQEALTSKLSASSGGIFGWFSNLISSILNPIRPLFPFL